MLIALSGGSDSLALLRLLAELRARRSLHLHAAHFDHGLRDGSREEALRVSGMARRAGVPCRVSRARGLAGGQEAYREARYRFLEAEADRLRVHRIALAHQADDQIETVLFRLLRGTGMRGLGGIPVRRGRFVRPLLGFRRDELRAELSRRGLEWIEDESNADGRYARPRIRHEVLPALIGASGGRIESILAELGGEARSVDRALDRRAERRLEETVEIRGHSGAGVQIARSGSADYDRAVLARILRKLAQNQGFRLSRGGTRSAVEFIRRGRSGGSVDVGGGLRLHREFDRFVLAPVTPPSVDRELEIASASAGRGTMELAGRTFGVVWGEEAGSSGPGWVAEVDEGAGFPLRLRGPRPGDRIRTRAGSRKVKKLLNERRVPLSERPQVPVLESADGRVLWIVGHSTPPVAATPRGGLTLRVEG